MTRVRARGEDVRRFILEKVGHHPGDISRVTAEHFGITRQAVNKHLDRLAMEDSIIQTGKTRSRSYKLATLLEWRDDFQMLPGLAEDSVWRDSILKALGKMPDNVLDIWHYGFTEMFNNAIDHSQGTWIHVGIKKTAVTTEIALLDNGIGIFKKIQTALNLTDERHAILELAKGKLTTDPSRHTGEGIFFSSRIFDEFDILSGGASFSHKFGDDWDWIFERDKAGTDGTFVWMKLSNHTARTLKKIFDQYTSGDDYGFTKTVVPVKLARYGNENLISRSQGKRLLARVELFKVVILDFQEVPSIGQAFADEVFRVFPAAHPEMELLPIHASSEVKRMIERAKSAVPVQTVTGSPSSDPQ
ncbi:MAG: STAS-like domain-containing protein [Steroidobacteraceae bacterium]